MNPLLKLFDQLKSAPTNKIWLDFFAFAKKRFAPRDLWEQPSQLIAMYNQAQNLLQSDVISFPVSSFYRNWLSNRPKKYEEWQVRKIRVGFKKLLALEEPKPFLEEVLTALDKEYRGHQPFILILDSPQKALSDLSMKLLSNESKPEPLMSEDDVDAAAMYMADYLRSFATLNLSGIVLEEDEEILFPYPDAMTLYQPIVNVARYYQWLIGVKFRGKAQTLNTNAIDFFLFGDVSLLDLFSFWQKGLFFGGGLNDDFWNSDLTTTEMNVNGLFFGTVPEDAEPETVLKKIKMLRHQ